MHSLALVVHLALIDKKKTLLLLLLLRLRLRLAIRGIPVGTPAAFCRPRPPRARIEHRITSASASASTPIGIDRAVTSSSASASAFTPIGTDRAITSASSSASPRRSRIRVGVVL